VLMGRDCLGFAEANLQRDKDPAYDIMRNAKKRRTYSPKQKTHGGLEMVRFINANCISGDNYGVSRGHWTIRRGCNKDGRSHENDGGILPS
jgi:hypothetical protein